MKQLNIRWVKNGKEALEIVHQEPFDLAILDIMMPEMDGFTLAAQLREQIPELPFVFLSAKSLKVDVLKGFAVGGVDFLKKPIDEEELVVRIKALLSRLSNQSETTISSESKPIGAYLFNAQNQELIYEAETIRLTARESELLHYLLLHQNQLCSHKDILMRIWKKNDYFTRKSLIVFITHLRKYLAKDPRIKIVNVHGKGFYLQLED